MNRRFSVLCSLFSVLASKEHDIVANKPETEEIAEVFHEALKEHFAAEDAAATKAIADQAEAPNPTPERRLIRHEVPIAQLQGELPPIDLYRLTGEDLRAFLAMHRSDTTNEQREALGFQLLVKAVPGGLAAIPFPVMGQYMRELNALLMESMSPNG
jgi:hypothetical protein